MNDTLRFLRAFVERPFATGAIAPSSQRLAAQMVDKLCLRDAETVVEIGPGTGALTRAILEDIAPRTLLLAVELNPRFAAHLRETLPARVDVVNGSGEHIAQYLSERGRSEADCIVSGLPWAGFTRDLQERLLAAVVSSLRPGGRFTTFAYVHGLPFPAARRLRRLLGAGFASVERSQIVWRNLPPAIVYLCEKGRSG